MIFLILAFWCCKIKNQTFSPFWKNCGKWQWDNGTIIIVVLVFTILLIIIVNMIQFQRVLLTQDHNTTHWCLVYPYKYSVLFPAAQKSSCFSFLTSLDGPWPMPLVAIGIFHTNKPKLICDIFRNANVNIIERLWISTYRNMKIMWFPTFPLW